MHLGYVVTRSVAVYPGDSAQDLDLIRSAHSKRNSALTGRIHKESGYYFQYLEGPCCDVFRVLETMREDNRHASLVVLKAGLRDSRLFNDWDMSFASGSLWRHQKTLDEAARFAGGGQASDCILEFLRETTRLMAMAG